MGRLEADEFETVARTRPSTDGGLGRQIKIIAGQAKAQSDKFSGDEILGQLRTQPEFADIG